MGDGGEEAARGVMAEGKGQEVELQSNGQLRHSLMESDLETGQAKPVRADRVLWFSVLSAICGCSCVGIWAVIQAVRASESWKQGDWPRARRLRHKALRLSYCSFVTCVLSVGVSLAFIVLLSYLIRLAR